METARREFTGPGETFRLKLAEADLLVRRRDFDRALQVLRSVPSDSGAYSQARQKMAEVYLKHRNNKRMFAGCYEELAYEANDVHSHVLLGEAVSCACVF
jgi:tetratricopeptide repeat protein 21B